jgi:competence protein ComFC
MSTAKLQQTVRFFWQGVNHLLWPAVCINCGENICETDGGLCKDCWGQLLVCCGGQYCQRCGRDAGKYAIVEGACPACMGTEIHFDRIARGGVYQDVLQKMILSLKKGRCELDETLGFLAQSALSGSGFKKNVDLFVPVPLHFSRRLVRGYNQSLITAKRLKKSRVQINTDLVRIRRTKAQPMMTSPAARAKNVKGAFAVRKGHKFAGKNICLIDDIKTTGATLNECARTLKQAGANKVFALVLAVAGQNLN